MKATGDGQTLPARNIGLPITIICQMTPKDIGCIRGRLFWDVGEPHMRLIHFSAAFVVITGGASRHQVCPNMLPAHVTRDDVIHSQIDFAPAAILTGIIVTTEYFAAR